MGHPNAQCQDVRVCFEIQQNKPDEFFLMNKLMQNALKWTGGMSKISLLWSLSIFHLPGPERPTIYVILISPLLMYWSKLYIFMPCKPSPISLYKNMVNMQQECFSSRWCLEQMSRMESIYNENREQLGLNRKWGIIWMIKIYCNAYCLRIGKMFSWIVNILKIWSSRQFYILCYCYVCIGKPIRVEVGIENKHNISH